MTRSTPHPLHVALAATVGLMVAGGVAPAVQAQGIQTPAERAKKQRSGPRVVEADRPAAYPQATRVAPETKPSAKTLKQLKELQALWEAEDKQGVIAQAESIVATPGASAYDKAYAYQVAGNAAADLDQQDRAIDFFAKSVEANGLDNDGHYNTLLNLASAQAGREKFGEALATMERFLAETRSTKHDHLAFRANLLANLERYAEAADAYKALLAANPGDKRLLLNTVATLQQAERFPEANGLLADAHARGLLTEARELRTLYVGLMNDARWADARAVMEAGQAKSILKPGDELAKDYMVLAQQAFSEDDSAGAIALYTRAAGMASDGEAYLNLAKVLEFAGRKAEAKAAAQKALDKGVKKPADAKALLAR